MVDKKDKKKEKVLRKASVCIGALKAKGAYNLKDKKLPLKDLNTKVDALG